MPFATNEPAGSSVSGEPAAADPARHAESAPPAKTAPIEEIVRDIREGLAQVSARELELRRREQEFERQFQDLKRQAEQAAGAELQQMQQRLAQQAADLNAQAVELASRRARLNQLAEQLRARQIELEQQKASLALQSQHTRQRVERLRAWEERQRTALEERAAALQRQEEELKRRLQLAHQDITRRRQELDQRAAQLDARAAELDELDRRLGERRLGLEQRLNEGEALAAEVERQQAELAAAQTRLEKERTELAQLRERLQSERARIAREWNSLELASQELVAERTRLAEAQAQVAGTRNELQTERQRLMQERRQTEELKRTLEAERTALSKLRQELEQQKNELDTERVLLGRERRRVEQAAAQLQAAQQAAQQRQQELEQRWQSAHQQVQQTSQQMDELEARRRMLERAEAECRERQERLQRREEQFQSRLATLEEEKRRLLEWESRLGQQESVAEQRLERVRAAEALLRQEQERIAALREQAEAHEAEARQNALELEVERRTLESAQAAVARVSQDLDRRRATHEEFLAVLRSAVARRLEQLRGAQRLGPRVTARWWLCAGAAATALAGVVFVAWLLLHPPRYCAAVALHFGSAAHGAPIADRRDLLLDPHLLAKGEFPPKLSADWGAACRDGRVRVEAVDGASLLRLEVLAEAAATAQQLVAAASQSYVSRLQELDAEQAAAGRADVISRRQQLVASVTQLEREQAAAESQPVDAVLDQRAAAAAAADALAVEIEQVAGDLERQRGELAALVALEVPRGSIAAAEIEQAVAADALYREERDEFAAVARQYRSELAVAMLQVVDPLKAARRALAQLAESLSEQQRLDPPAEIRALLGQTATTVRAGQERLENFAQQWQTWLEAVRNIEVRDDAAALVNQQNTVADGARALTDALVNIVDEVGARLDALYNQGSGGTRQVVVAAVLRSDHAAVAAAVETLLGAAKRLSPTENVELDAQDRKLRGLQMRLTARRAALEQQLQLEADRLARDAHAARINDSREQIRQLERRREELVTNLLSATKRMLAADELARRQALASAVSQQRAAEIAWLRHRIAALDDELRSLAADAAVTPVEVGPVSVTRVASGRYRDAALAAAGTFAAVWLASLALIAPGWGRRRPPADPWAEVLNILEAGPGLEGEAAEQRRVARDGAAGAEA